MMEKIASWQLAVGSWQLAVGSWQLAVGSNFKKLLPLLKQFFITIDGVTENPPSAHRFAAPALPCYCTSCIYR